MRLFIFLFCIALSGCNLEIFRKESSSARIPVSTVKREIFFVKIDSKLTEPVKSEAPPLPSPDGSTTCGMALTAAKANQAALEVCNSRLIEIGEVEGTAKPD